MKTDQRYKDLKVLLIEDMVMYIEYSEEITFA